RLALGQGAARASRARGDQPRRARDGGPLGHGVRRGGRSQGAPSRLPDRERALGERGRGMAKKVTARKKAPAPRKAPKESPAEARARMGRILKKLKRAYPYAECALHHENAFQLIAATILSAQCTDARVNMVTPALFKRFPDAHAMAQ